MDFIIKLYHKYEKKMMTTLTNKMSDILLFGTGSTNARIQLEKT
jgi:hypothetical protein